MHPNEFPEGDERRLRIPPGARHQRFERHFSKNDREDLERAGVTTEQLERLHLALRVIAYYTQTPPALADVRKSLNSVADNALATVKALEALLDAPDHELARDEARLRLLESIEECYPDRCLVDAKKINFFEQYDPRKVEAERLRDVVASVAKLAVNARERMPDPTKVSKAPAHWYPIFYIDVCLRKDADGKTIINASASPTSKFRRIVGICYEAAGAPKTDPERAIRDYLKTLDKGSKN